MAVPLEHGAVGELFWSTRDAVALLRDGRIVAWNPAAERMFGIPAGVATGESFDLGDVFGPAAEQVAGVLAAGTGWVRVEVDGDRPFAVEAIAWWLRDSDVLVAVFRDLSAQARYEHGLRQLSAFARDMLLDLPGLPELAQRIAQLATVLTGASNGALVLARPGGEGVTRFAAAGPSGGSADWPAEVASWLGSACAHGEPVRFDATGARGTAGTGAFLAVPLPVGGSAGDEIAGEVAVANGPGRRSFADADERLLVDLAAHAAVALRWAEAAEQAHQEEQRRRDVTNAARHDIANPLSVGRGYLAMLEQRYDRMTPDQRAMAFGGLRQAFQRLDEFSRRLLVDDRLVLEGVDPDWGELPLDPLLAAVAHDHTLAAERRGTVVAYELADGCPQSLAGDAQMVREALDNLVGNAVKYSPDGATVRLVAGPEGADAVRIEVSDSGPGIPVEEQAQLFQRFARTEASRRDGVPGMGLGLSIVRRLVAAHGGRVGVRSVPGAGATFWLTLPVRVPAGQPGSA